MLKIYDPRANVVVSLKVSSPEGPEVVSIIVVVYEPLFWEPGWLGAAGCPTVEIDAVDGVGVGTAGVETAGVETAGVETAGVETAGVGTAGVGTAGVRTAEAGEVGIGSVGGYDDGAGCGLLMLVLMLADLSGVWTASGRLVYDVETLVRAVTPIFTVPLPPPYEVQLGTVRWRNVATPAASEFNP
jgi:hypothetical protein